MRRKALWILVTGSVLILCSGASAASTGGISKKTHSSGHLPPKSRIAHPPLSPALVKALKRGHGARRSFARTASTPTLASARRAQGTRGVAHRGASVAGAIASALTTGGTSFVQTGASFVTAPLVGTPDGVSFESFAPFGFPSDGSSFAVLTTGDSSSANEPNDPSAGGVSDQCTPGGACGADGDPTSKGANRQGAHDVTILKIPLVIPKSGGNCLSFDFRFLSQEYPVNAQTPYNDAFIAELDKNTWTATGLNPNAAISAPANFAGDVTGQPISIAATTLAQITTGAAAGTTYNAATPVLRASTPITAGSHILYLSIFDQKDAFRDSAAFVDGLNLSTAAAGQCTTGAVPDELPADVSAVTSANVLGSENADYTVTLHNDGPAAASDVTFTMSLYQDLTYSGVDGAECTTPDALTVICSVGAMDAGATKPVTVHTTISGDAYELFTDTEATSATFDPNQGNNDSYTDNWATGSPPSPPTSDMSVGTSAVDTPQGSVVTIPLTITNNGTDDFTGNVFTYTYVSTSLSFIGYALPGGEDSPTGFQGCYATYDSEMGCEFDNPYSLPNAGTFTIDLYAYVLRSGWITAQTQMYSDGFDPNSSNNSSFASFGAAPTTYPTSNISLIQTTSDFAPRDGLITYTVKATNAGPKEAIDVEVEDLQPFETTGAGVSDTLGGCSTLAGGGGFDCHVDLKAGQTDTFTYKVTVNHEASNGDYIVNTVDALPTTAYYDPSLADNYWYAYTVVAPDPAEPADLALKLSSPSGTIVAGTSITTSATVTNKGPAGVQHAWVELDSWLLEYGGIVSEPAGCSATDYGLECNVGPLAKGASKTVKIVWYPLVGGESEIYAYSFSNDLTWEDPAYDNNNAFAPLTVIEPAADLGITMDDAVDPIVSGANQTYTIKVTNPNSKGGDAATGVQIVDTLPTGLTFVSASGKGFSCVPTVVITCSLKGTLPAATTATLTLVAKVGSVASPIINTASVASSSLDWDPTDNTASVSTTLGVD